jgi:hypothetical protein
MKPSLNRQHEAQSHQQCCLRAEGLSTNDFIVAAKINAQDLKPMLKRKAARFWA